MSSSNESNNPVLATMINQPQMKKKNKLQNMVHPNTSNEEADSKFQMANIYPNSNQSAVELIKSVEVGNIFNKNTYLGVKPTIKILILE